MNETLFTQILSGNPGISLTVTAADLKNVVAGMFRQQQEAVDQALARHRERPTMTREQTAKALNVSLATLWRWDKIGYLKPVKIGASVMYRASDVDAMLNRKSIQA